MCRSFEGVENMTRSFKRNISAEELSSGHSVHALHKRRCSGEDDSPPLSSEAAMDISSGAASAATTELTVNRLAQQYCHERSTSPETLLDGGHCNTDIDRKLQSSKQHDSNPVKVLDLRKHPQWLSVREQLSRGLATALSNNRGHGIRVTSHRVQQGSLSEDAGGLYLRCEMEEQQALLDQALCHPCSSTAAGPCEGSSLERMRLLAADPSSQVIGESWASEPVTADGVCSTATGRFVQEALEVVRPLLPAALQPAECSSGSSENWLSYSCSGVSASGAWLQSGEPLWPVGFTKSAAALAPVCLSLPVSPHAEAAFKEQGVEQQQPQKLWMVQQDQDAVAGTELILRNWRAEASGEPLATGAHTWEEVESQAVVFGPGNTLGSAEEVLQGPGQLVALQRQGYCGWASGGFYLNWNVTTGAEWPGHALREGRIRSNAMRQAAISSRNPWLNAELHRQPSLHVLRLLFAAACSLPQVHPTLLEGLQQHFLPLCQVEADLQSDCSLPQLNSRRGLLESQDPSDLTCSCCGGEFLFSFISLIERKGDREGSICWQCWHSRQRIGLESDSGPPRNARKCVVVAAADLQRLMGAMTTLPCKRAKLS